MNRKLKTIIDNHTQDLERINKQRRIWLYASSVVIIGIVGIMFAWDWLEGFHSKSIWWLVVSLMLVVSINWWYWTMKVLRRIIDHQKTEFELIGVIITEIKEVKKDIQFLAPNNIDKQE